MVGTTTIFGFTHKLSVLHGIAKHLQEDSQVQNVLTMVQSWFSRILELASNVL